MSAASLSFVIPCLNEVETLPGVLAAIEGVRRGALADRDVEVIVADNGSTDGSQEVARRHGAVVVDCPVRGYGAALRCGIEHARHDVVVYADADGTYDLTETPRLLVELERGCDLVLGSRLRGTIHRGAMPFLHRWVGTPLLTFFLNRLHAGDGQRISDCNSGFRCLRRRSFHDWNMQSTGMEFASEVLVRCLRSGARVGEVPVSLRPDPRQRRPHLKTWRDGMRHLLQIFAGSPSFFLRAGLGLLALNWAVLIVGLLYGPVQLPGANVFGLHTMMFALLGTCFGLNVFGIGLLLAAREAQPRGAYGRLLGLDEGRLLWGGVGLLVAVLAISVVPILRDWAAAGYRFLDLEKETLVLVAFGANGVFFLFNLVAAHLVKRP